MKRFIFHCCFAAVLGIVVVVFFKIFPFQRDIVIFPDNQNASVSNAVEGPGGRNAPQENPLIKMIAVGDIMLARGIEYEVKKDGEGDYRFPFQKIFDYLKPVDIVFGNLESVISDKGRKAGSIYSFRAEPDAVTGLVFAGFNVVSVANNHVFDYTRDAFEDSLSRLQDAKIEYVGGGFDEKEAFSLKIKEIRNTKIGFLAYSNLGPSLWKATDSTSGIAWIDPQNNDVEKVRAAIKEAKPKVDVLVVSFHWGDEYESEPNELQMYWALDFIDSGADLVIGHHPHVPQAIEEYNGGWIAYSLGNFVFDQNFSEETQRGFLLEVNIENKKIKEVLPREIKFSNSFQPFLGGQDSN